MLVHLLFFFIVSDFQLGNSAHLKHVQRSPLDIKTTLDLNQHSGNVKIHSSHHLATLVTVNLQEHPEQSIVISKILKGNIVNNLNEIPQHDDNAKLSILANAIPAATSNVHHSAIHVGIKHLIANDNIKIPIVTHTLLHNSASIAHPSKIVPILIPIAENNYAVKEKKASILEDLSVIPLQKHDIVQAKLMMQVNNQDDYNGNNYRTFYGGHGQGLSFGGQGAGHGFYSVFNA